MARRVSKKGGGDGAASNFSKADQKLLPLIDADENLNIASLKVWLWDAACAIRGATDASKFKDFILPLVFYKHLSDVFDDEFAAFVNRYGDEVTGDEIIKADYQDALAHNRTPIIRFYIPRKCRWPAFCDHPINGKLGDFVTYTFREVVHWNPILQGILDIRDYNERQSGQRTLDDVRLAALIEILSRHRLGPKNVEPIILGEAFEYLIRKFAEGQGQSAGEFYTPKEISRLLAGLIDPKPYSTIYDGACGSGGFLISARRFFEEKHPQEKSKAPTLHGQELNPVTASIAKMNLLLHGFEDTKIAIGDTFRNPYFIGGKAGKQTFDYVVSNPMWNQNGYNIDFYQHDPWQRFNAGIPPQSTADWGWIQHSFAVLNDHGHAAIVLDTGAMSRGSSNKSSTRERDIRKAFVEKDVVEAVVLLPENLFYNTSASGILLLLNRNKLPEHKEQILLIDASMHFSKGRPKNQLTKDGIEAITKVYRIWKTLSGLSRIITISDARNAEYNLNPSFFVNANENRKRTLGYKLLSLRQNAGLSEKDLADLIDSKTSLLQALEAGNYIPNSMILRELIQVHLFRNMFKEGLEQEEVEGLWKLARNAGMKALFDEKWFKDLLDKKDQQVAKEPITIFCSYAREDEAYYNELEQHLVLLRRQGLISEYHYHQIVPGTNIDIDPDPYSIKASIILFLISPNFLASDYIYSREVMQALERQKTQKANVIPIILQPVDWEATPLVYLQVLPRQAKPITLWMSRDEAFLDIAKSLRRLCEDLLTITVSMQKSPIKESGRNLPDQQSTLRLFEVFVRSGVPKITFVKIEDFDRLKLSLEEPSRGIVIEGPSGIGKTTAVQKAIEELDGKQVSGTEPFVLSARNKEHREKIQTLVEWHKGTVIIDDFHRLDPRLREELSDYLKYLADTEPLSKKLVIVGIPQTGRRLIETAHDIATRIEIFKLGLVKDELIQEMIEKGEKALNINLARKAEIALAASGSLNIAQFLCFNICYKHIQDTQEELRQVHCNIDEAVTNVVNELSRKFDDTIRYLAGMGEPTDSTMILILEELANSEDGILSLRGLKERRPSLVNGIDRLLREHWMDKLYNTYTDSVNYLFFDQNTQNLVVEDPQLTFYLKKRRPSLLSKEVGKSPRLAQRKVFISYSHMDIKWLNRLKVHLKPIERKGTIELWDDTKIIAGARWKDEILEAVCTSRVAVVLISADFIASDFISEYELPMLLSRAEDSGTIIIPVIISHCLFNHSGLSIFQAATAPNKPLSALEVGEQEEVFVRVAETILKILEKDDI